MFGASSINIGIDMFLRDRFTAPSQRIGASSEILKQKLKAFQAETERLKWSRNINLGLTLVGVGALRGLSQAVTKAADFQYTMERVKAVTGATNDEMSKLSYHALDLGRKTMFFGKDVANAMEILAKAGATPKNLANLSTGAVYLAGATGQHLEGEGGAADIMVGITNMFGINSKASMRVADVLTKAANASNIGLNDLAETIKYTGTTAHQLRLSLEQTSALAMVIGNAGLKGTMGGTAIENMLRYFTRAITMPTKQQGRALASLGLSGKNFIDQNGNLMPLEYITENLNKALLAKFGEGNTVYKQAILEQIFGVRGKRAAALALRFTEDYSSFLNTLLKGSSGEAERVTKQIMNSLSGYIDRVKSNWETVRNTFVGQITPLLKGGLAILEKVLDVVNGILNIPGVGKLMSLLITRFIVVKTLTWAWRTATLSATLVMRSLGKQSATTAGETILGFRGMTAAARQYFSTLNAGYTATGFAKGPMYRDARGRFVKNPVGGLGSIIGGVGIGSFLGRILGVASGKGLGTALKFLGKGLLGASPWGWVATAAMFIPDIISAIRNNNEETRNNTGAIQNSNQSTRQLSTVTGQLVGVMDSFRVTHRSPTLSGGIINGLAEKYGSFDRYLQMVVAQMNGKPQQLNIYADGEKKVSQMITGHEKQIVKNTMGIVF